MRLLEKIEENSLYIMDNAENIASLTQNVSGLTDNQNKIKEQIEDLNEKISSVETQSAAADASLQDTIDKQKTDIISDSKSNAPISLVS